MSDSLTIDPASPARQPRRDRPDRQPSYRDDEPATTFEVADNPSPDDIVADGARQLQERDRELAESRRIARENSQAAAAANARLEQVTATQLTDRQAIVGQALESANSEMALAEMALQSAIEAGDAKAQVAASKAIGAATFRVSQASAELEAMKAQPRPQQRTQTPNAPQMSAKAQEWLDSHPRYNSDKPYKALAQMAHNEAVGMGHSVESQAYIDHIERILTDQYGDNHGHVPSVDQGRTQPVNNPRTPSARDGVPSSRSAGGGVNNQGYRLVKTQLHKDPLQVTYKSDGTIAKVKFGTAEQQKDFVEGAETCRMKLEDYVMDHIAIAKEIEAGGSGDLVRGEGRHYE